MGALSAIALQDEELNLSLEDQIAIHLATNVYPKPPAYMVDVAIQALDYFNSGQRTALIKLPEGVSWRGAKSMGAYQVIEAYSLGMWVIESELD